MSEKTSTNWKIENFSYFNNVVHTKRIRSPMLYFSYCKHMELYPRGISGIDEHLVVRFCDIKKDFSGGRLSFISSDGSILCTLQVKRVNIKNVIDSPLGPKYDDVIAQIRKDENEDQLTLLFIPASGKILEQRMCTNIDVLKISLEIGKISFETVKSDKLKNCYFVFYLSHIERGKGIINFKINCENEGIQLMLEPVNKIENHLVKTCVKLQSNNGTLVMYEENKHVFVSEEPWTFSDSLKLHEVMDISNTLILCVKIVKGELKLRYNHVCSPAYVTVQNTNVVSEKQGPTSSFKQTGESLTKPTKDSDATSNQLENSVSALAKELMCLYQDQNFSDLQLKCGSVSFPVHKNILSTRSPVFKRMLSNDMREAASGTVVIEDLDVSTLARFLAFLYSGSVDDLEGESALKLYYGADKYQVPTLKKECVDFLLANVSLSNVCDVLSLAYQHQDDMLLSAARDFILNNLNEVSRSKEWMSFMKREPLLAVETMTKITAIVSVTKR